MSRLGRHIGRFMRVLLAMRDGVSSKRLSPATAVFLGGASTSRVAWQQERIAKRNQTVGLPALLTAIPAELARVEPLVRDLVSEHAQ